MRWSSIVLGAGLACAVCTASADSMSTAAALRDRALADRRTYDLLEELTATLGPRPVGTPPAARARDWAIATMKRLGFKNVHAEEFTTSAWIRGAESAEIVSPLPQHLAILGLGSSVQTPPEGVEGQIVVLKSYAEVLAAPPHAFDGKIVVVNQPMTRTQNGRGYGSAVVARSGASEAAKRGAIAYLTRSISTGTGRAPHTGHMSYLADVPKIPAAALGVPDADQLQALAARGPVRIHLQLDSHTDEHATAWNVSGDIRGSETPDEIVVTGGHLDSWDPGTGAIDDGAGCAMTLTAAALIGEGHHPRRTIRVVLFGSEEQQGSDVAYLAAHKDELPHIVLASEADSGSDHAYALQLPPSVMAATGLTEASLKPLATLLAPLDVMISTEVATRGGSDISEIVKAGVPVFVVNQDSSRYFDYHHSADDTMAIVDRAELNQATASWVTALYFLADSAVDFRKPPAALPAESAH